ncbi:MAG: NHL repeat-containing protein [Thermodesulfobacteriota bacterium]
MPYSVGGSSSGYKASLALIMVLSLAALSYAVPMRERAVSFHVTTVAGTGAVGRSDGKALEATFKWPTGVAVSPDGTVVYVADYSNNLIRKIDSRGSVTTFAGSGEAGYGDGVGTGAVLRGPDNIAVDAGGNLFVGDADNFRIRKVSPEGVVTTVAGNGHMGYRDGKAEEAMFGYPTGVAVDAVGNVYVADRRAHAVRKITPDGTVSTLAGNGRPGYADGRGLGSHLREPVAVAVDGRGTVYVSDSGNNAIRKITPDGTITTLAGRKEAGYRDGVGTDAMFSWPTGIAVGMHGIVYVCDSGNNKIRSITPGGAVSTVAGSLTGGAMDGPGFKASFNFPTGVGVGRRGTIYIADSGNNAIRKITYGTFMEASLGQ